MEAANLSRPGQRRQTAASAIDVDSCYGGGQGGDVAKEAETAVPQMRTYEFGKGMARRIDSEVREDGVTATGDGTKMVQPDGL